MLKILFLASRPKTLTAAIVPILVASVLIYKFQGNVSAFLISSAVFACLGIQIGTNLVNDAEDFKKGADDSKRLGPKRATAEGWLSYDKVMRAAHISFAFSALFGVPLVIAGGIPILLLGLVSIGMGYLYTMGKYSLAYTGLGDLFVILFFGLFAVPGMGIVLSETPIWENSTLFTSLIVAGLQVGFSCATLIAINNLRDCEQDVKVNKKTLAVRLGISGARIEILCLYLGTFLFGIYWIKEFSLLAFALPLVGGLIAIKLVSEIFRTPPSTKYNIFLAQAGALHLVFGILLSIGISLSSLKGN